MKRFLRSLGHGGKGFTLIEILVVVALLGVLSAVVVPNVIKFMGEGKTEAMLTELHNVQTVMHVGMTDNELTAVTPQATWVNDLTDEPGEFNLRDYLTSPHTEYYYRWDGKGVVEQSEDGSE